MDRKDFLKARIMEGMGKKSGTKPMSDKEKSLAALAHPKDKITHKDVLVGRGVLKKEEVELDEMDKSQPSSSRGAEGLPLGKKAEPIKTDKAKQDALKALQKQYKKVKEEVEQVDEGNKENKAKKNTYVANIIKKKLSSQVLPSLKFGRRELKKEEVEQIDELKKGTLMSYVGKAREKNIKDSAKNRLAGTETSLSTIDKQQAKVSKRSKGIQRAYTRLNKEEVEQIDELKKSTMASYVKKAAASYGRDKQLIGRESPDGTVKKARPEMKKAVKNRLAGINRAAERLAKEEVEQIDEASWTSATSMHGATRKQNRTNPPTHNIRKGDVVKTSDGKKGAVSFVDGDDIHVTGTNIYYPKKTEKHSASTLKKEEVDLDEAFINGREYASHGLMHPDHAKWQSHRVGVHTDFYAHGTGDKINGQVMKNDGKEVHIKATKSSGGKLHKFKVQSALEASKMKDKAAATKHYMGEEVEQVDSHDRLREAAETLMVQEEIGMFYITEFAKENNIEMETLELMSEEQLNEILGAIARTGILGKGAQVGALERKSRLLGREAKARSGINRAKANIKRSKATARQNSPIRKAARAVGRFFSGGSAPQPASVSNKTKPRLARSGVKPRITPRPGVVGGSSQANRYSLSRKRPSPGGRMARRF